MNTKHILAASIAAVCLVQSATAANVTVRLTGSSAYRAAVSNAIKNVLSSGSPQIAYDNAASSFSGATYQTFVGTLAGVGTVTVKTKWTGSVQGILDTSAGNTIEFFADGVAVSTGGTPVAAPTATEGVPDIAMADNTQGATPYKSPALNVTGAVGIVPFFFVASKDVTSNITNMTAQAFKQLVGAGSLRASVITGNSADTQMIFAAGRDPGSGTRLDTLSETGFGTLNLVTQYRPVTFDSTNVNTVTHVDIYPPTATVTDPGNDGEAGGGGVAKILRRTTTSFADDFIGGTFAGGFIGYVGESDSYNAVFGIGNTLTGSDQGNARYLTYNGVSAVGGITKKPSGAVVTAAGSGFPDRVQFASTDETGLIVGQIVTGDNIPPGSTIASINTTNHYITLDKTIATFGASTNLQIGAFLPAAVRNGAYTFWNYEQMLWKSTVVGTSGDKFTVATAIKTEVINNTYSYSGIANDAAMLVQRAGDGKPVSKKVR